MKAAKKNLFFIMGYEGSKYSVGKSLVPWEKVEGFFLLVLSHFLSWGSGWDMEDWGIGLAKALALGGKLGERRGIFSPFFSHFLS